MKNPLLFRTLKEKKLIKNENAFYLAARYRFFRFLAGSPALKLESGVYRISSAMSVADIFALASSGKKEYVRIAFPEGLTISKIAERLEKSGICSASDFKASAKDGEIIKKYDIFCRSPFKCAAARIRVSRFESKARRRNQGDFGFPRRKRIFYGGR